MNKKSRDGTYRGNPNIYKFSSLDLTEANKVRIKKADDYANDVFEHIRYLVENNYSLSKIVTYLRKKNMKTIRNKEFTRSAVSRIIKRYRQNNSLEQYLV